jgi:YD repeat-containing protein
MLQGGANLDTMRSSDPQPPAAYQQTGTLPPSTYDDPRPLNTANYSSYLSEMTSGGNATGLAGGKPMQSVDPTAGSASVGGFSYNLDSQNFNFTAPVLSLAGRAGMGLSLGLSNNNKVWLRDANTNTVIFNPNRDFPAPGWRIGFGSILIESQADPPYTNSFTGKQSLLYAAPDGTRRDLAYNSSSGYYESYDASYLRFDLANKILYMPDGARAAFLDGSYANGAAQLLPSWVKDRNGNTINVYYKTLSNNAVVIDYAIDTAARRIDFNYQNNRLTSVSQNRGGSVFYFVRIDYNPVTIQTGFSGSPALDPSNINNSQVYFPVRLSYPSGAQYRFGYNSYGQVNAVEKWAPTITGQGNERKIASTTFVYTISSPYTAPSFSQRQEWAENWQGGQTQTYQYSYWGASGHVILDPTYREFRVWNNGLNHSSSVWASSAGNFTKKDEVTYVTDSGANPRIAQTKSTAWNGTGYNIRTTNIGYTQLDGMWLPSTKDDLSQDGVTVYRRATTSYTSYPSRYILGLPQTVSVYAGAGVTLLSRSTSNYDETGTYTDSNGQTANYFIDAGGANVTQHDSSYNISLTQRGNLTSVVQSSVVNGAVTGTRTVKRISYDTNGNVRAEADGAANRKQFQYGDYCTNKPGGVGETHLIPYTASDPTGFRAGSQWEYYTGLTIKSFNMLSGGSTELQAVTTSYDFSDRALQTTRPDGGWAKTAYWDNWLATVTSQQVEAGKVRYKFGQYDGAGRGYKKSSDHPDGVSGKFAGQISVFDKVGQVEDSSNVIEIGGAWVPAGDDAATGFLFTHLTRDELGRLKIVTFPDNNTKQIAYTGCGCAGNAETRVTDELGHYTITKTDFLGRLTEAIEPSGTTYDSVYSKAVYVYDELDRLVTINHSKTPTGGQTPTQTRTFGYDGYGRLASENTPEGGIVNYTYTANDLAQTMTNQRNITVTNSYNTRNLPTQTSYSDGTPTATFGYDAYGARETMTDGEGATSYVYNSYRQLQSETRTFTGLPNNTYTLGYSYNQGDQLKSVNYLVTTGGVAGPPSTRYHVGKTFAPPYTVSGVVTDSQGQPVSGVTVTLEGTQSGQQTTGGGGTYSFSGLAAGNYTLTPS